MYSLGVKSPNILHKSVISSCGCRLPRFSQVSVGTYTYDTIPSNPHNITNKAITTQYKLTNVLLSLSHPLHVLRRIHPLHVLRRIHPLHVLRRIHCILVPVPITSPHSPYHIPTCPYRTSPRVLIALPHVSLSHSPRSPHHLPTCPYRPHVVHITSPRSPYHIPT